MDVRPGTGKNNRRIQPNIISTVKEKIKQPREVPNGRNTCTRDSSNENFFLPRGQIKK
jgi:hypothetical protein